MKWCFFCVNYLTEVNNCDTLYASQINVAERKKEIEMKEKMHRNFTERIIISLDCEITKAAYDDMQMSQEVADSMIIKLQQINYKWFKGLLSSDEVMIRINEVIQDAGFESKRFYAQIQNRLNNKFDKLLPCEIKAYQDILIS